MPRPESGSVVEKLKTLELINFSITDAGIMTGN